MHLNSELMFKKHALKYFRPGLRVLEIGPDSFPSAYRVAVGIDIEWHTLDIHPNPYLTYPSVSEYSFPIRENSYDIVLSGQVLEHVRKPWIWIKELARVCKPDGLVITINPVSWPYHEAPVDCWRAYPEGIRALYEDANLEVLFSQFESLETPEFRRALPGRSRSGQPPKLIHAYNFLGRFGFPVERAFDTISIGKKMHDQTD
jgi:SAM-dependent methyltransferase